MTKTPARQANSGRRTTTKTANSAGAQLRARLDRELGDGLVWDHRELEILDRAAAMANVIAALDAAVQRDGLTVVGSTGQLRLHPAVAELRASRALLVKFLDMLKLPQDSGVVRSARSERKARNVGVRWGRGA